MVKEKKNTPHGSAGWSKKGGKGKERGVFAS